MGCNYSNNNIFRHQCEFLKDICIELRQNNDNYIIILSKQNKYGHTIFNPIMNDDCYNELLYRFLINDCNCVKLHHIFTTYRVPFILSTFLPVHYYIITTINTYTDIHLFFSFYTPTEKINLMSYLSYIVIRGANIEMIKYIINFLFIHIIEIPMTSWGRFHVEDYLYPERSTECIKLSIFHNENVIFNKSLRATWMKSCII